MQEQPYIQTDSDRRLASKKRWGLRMIIFSVLLGLLGISIGFHKIVTTSNGSYATSTSVVESVAATGLYYIAFGGVVTGIILLASRKRPVTNVNYPTAVTVTNTTTVDTLGQVSRSNRTKLVVALLCLTIPATMLLIGILVGVTIILSAGDGQIPASSRELGNVALVFIIIGANSFVPGVVAGIALLVNRRKIIRASN